MKLLVLDDHEIIREGLSAFLRQRVPDAIILQAATGEEACRIAAEEPELSAAILDLTLPGMDGFSVITEIARARPALAIVVLSSSESQRDVRRALADGARGYVPKSSSMQTLWLALQLAMSGEVYVPPLVLGLEQEPPRQEAERQWPPLLGRLTNRQVAVLRMIGAGASNKEIARALDLAEKTVKVHVSGIFKTLNVVNRRQASEAARQLPQE